MKDQINPDHYKGDGMDSIEVIESFSLGFCLGNVIKYVLRAGKKDNEVQDLTKAKWYLNRRITQLQNAKNNNIGSARDLSSAKNKKR